MRPDLLDKYTMETLDRHYSELIDDVRGFVNKSIALFTASIAVVIYSIEYSPAQSLFVLVCMAFTLIVSTLSIHFDRTRKLGIGIEKPLKIINTSEDVIDFVKITKIKMVEDASILADKMRRTWSIGLISFGIGLAIMMMESIV